MSKIRLAASAVVLTLTLTACAGAGGSNRPVADDYYDGQTVTLIVPFAPGGSADVLARLVAAELPKHLEGSPNIVVENIDGGGGASGMQRLMSRRADGLTLVMGTSGNLTRWLLEEPGHDYPLDEMPPIASITLGNVVTMARTDRAPTLDELVESGDEIKAGNTSAGSSIALEQVLAAKAIGIDLVQVFGYSGIGDLATAMERDEIALASPPESAFRTTFASLVDGDVAQPLWQNGYVDESGAIVRSETQPDVPTFIEEYERIVGEPFTGNEADAYEALIASDSVGSTIYTHPDVDDELVTILTDAMAEMAGSDSWIEQCETSFGSVATVPPREQTQTALTAVFEADDAVVETLRDMTTEGR